MKTLKRLLAEIVDLFPDEYIHIGSDETFTNNKKCTLEGSLTRRVRHSDCRLTYRHKIIGDRDSKIRPITW